MCYVQFTRQKIFIKQKYFQFVCFCRVSEYNDITSVGAVPGNQRDSLVTLLVLCWQLDISEIILDLSYC